MLNSLASAGRRALPNQWDLIAFAAILAVLTAIAKSYHGISAPLPAASESTRRSIWPFAAWDVRCGSR